MKYKFWVIDKKLVNWVEKENSYPHKIIIERLAEGCGRSNQFWSEAYIKHWNKKAERVVLKDID